MKLQELIKNYEDRYKELDSEYWELFYKKPKNLVEKNNFEWIAHEVVLIELVISDLKRLEI